ncbi:MAG: SpoIIE family protein phosphatase [Desulfovibrionaceae bacterium]
MKNAITILVVDDSRTMRMTLSRFLGEHYVVEQAENGQQAIALYEACTPDILLLDINMPLVDGFGVIEHIRATRGDQDTFILMLTAEEERSLKPRALNLGANDFLYKPFDRTELLARVGVAARQILLSRERQTYLEHITHEIEMVAALQSRLLPQQSPYMREARVTSLYRPSGQASGDYYDFFPVGDDTLRAVVADVSGHGARAAFLMAIVRTLMRMAVTDYVDLPDTFERINSHLRELIGDEDDFVTMFAADINFADNKITYINAGHCPGMLLTGTDVTALTPQAPMLGFFDVHYASDTVGFAVGAKLFLYTDGFYEWQPPGGIPFDHDVFWDIAAATAAEGEPFLDKLMVRLESLADGTPRFRDDLTALWIQLEP